MSEGKKLWRVSVRMIGEYGVAYVVARDPTAAYETYREFLDTQNLGFTDARELSEIELLAEDARYPECKVRLFTADD